MSSRRRFRPTWFVTLAAIAFCSLTLWLGNWQWNKAEQKQSLRDTFDRLAHQPSIVLPATRIIAEEFNLRRVQVSGEYDEQRSILLDNKVYRGRVGYHVVTPLRIDASDVFVLIDRGWAPAGRTRSELPRISTPGGVQHVEGMATIPSTRVLELSQETAPGRVWQNLLLDRYQAWSGLALQPVVIQQSNETGDGLVRDWPQPDLGIEKNRSYALQWYSLCALTVVLYVVLNFKKQS